MTLFGKKEQEYLGIDVGGNVIKLVQLKNVNGRPQLVTYGYAQRSATTVTSNFLDQPEELAGIIKDLCEQSKVTTKDAITALPAPAVFSSILNLPTITKSDIKNRAAVEAAVQAEARKVVPLPLEEMILDWKVLPQRSADEGGKEQFQVLLTGAAKKLVKKYMDIFTMAGLNLVSLETESFALSRALIGNDRSVIMIVDVGALNTYLLIVDGGVPFFDRTIGTAGFDITQAISHNLGIPLEQAEQFKFDFSLHSSLPSDKLPKVIQDVVAPIIHEIKYSFNLYLQDEYGGREVEKIVLTGGTAQLPYLADHLSKILNTSVYIGDPWARVIYPQELRPILDEIGSQFAIAMGLAMRDFE